jgi:23S rRNA (pseudouridine1915-N3)-methyltransferase
MQAAILCLGKLREKHWRQAADEYLKRLSRYGRVEEIELADEPEPAEDNEALARQVMDREAAKLLGRLKPGDYVIALCIDGKQWDSVDFANHLTELPQKGYQRIVFMIGGSLGLGEAAVSRSDEKMSLSKMTFPHQLARVLLLEQIYRAAKISAGERYHK